MNVYVCDAIMGSGKTSAAIDIMRGSTSPPPFLDIHPPYIFVTQFLTEVQRVRSACPGFREPINAGDGKLVGMKALVGSKANIASTHALFYRYDADLLNAIREAHYTLILDEVVDVIRMLDLTRDDIQFLFDAGLISAGEDRRVHWEKPEYSGRWADVRNDVETSCVTFEDGKLLVWTLPVELFEAFDSVVVLTYMFGAQYQHYYFLHNNVAYTRIGVDRTYGGAYIYTETPPPSNQKSTLPEIEFIDSPSLLAIGDGRTALSSNWFRRAEDAQIEEVRNNMYNVFRNKWNAKGADFMWSTYLHARDAVSHRGYRQSFLAYNARATNDWSDRHYLAYAVNLFPMPDEAAYFSNRGFMIDEDAMALSTMVQWLWRSAIRRGEKIWLYLPSRRMRRLITKYLTDIST